VEDHPTKYLFPPRFAAGIFCFCGKNVLLAEADPIKRTAEPTAADGTVRAVLFSLQKNIQILQNPLQFAG